MDSETRKFFSGNPDLLENEIRFWDHIQFGSNVEEHLQNLKELQQEIQRE